MNILLVCTGNTCRSSMAEGILKKILEDWPDIKSQFNVASAGLSAYDGDKASHYASEVLAEEWGISLDGHRAKRLTYEMVRDADIILTMTRAHKNAILANFNDSQEKVHTLKEFVGNKNNSVMHEYDYGVDIADPYGMPKRYYALSAQEIKKALEELVRILADMCNEL